MDACPGRLNQTAIFINREGFYYGQCSEICGIEHGFMPIGIKAVSKEFFFNFLNKSMLSYETFFPGWNFIEILKELREMKIREVIDTKIGSIMGLTEDQIFLSIRTLPKRVQQQEELNALLFVKERKQGLAFLKDEMDLCLIETEAFSKGKSELCWEDKIIFMDMVNYLKYYQDEYPKPHIH